MINLEKGQKIDLTKGNEGLKKIIVGLGWDTNKFDGSGSFDLDAAVFMVNENEKCGSQKDFIFYGNLKHSTGSVVHLGDNLTGAGDGDDEQVKVDLSKVPADVSKLVFAVSIYQGEARNQNFGMISNSFIRLIDEDKSEELVKFDLGEDFSTETSIVLGELYRHNGEWKFKAEGSGFEGSFKKLTNTYGL
jgi:tellurium resistance protein TerD